MCTDYHHCFHAVAALGSKCVAAKCDALHITFIFPTYLHMYFMSKNIYLKMTKWIFDKGKKNSTRACDSNTMLICPFVNGIPSLWSTAIHILGMKC